MIKFKFIKNILYMKLEGTQNRFSSKFNEFSAIIAFSIYDIKNFYANNKIYVIREIQINIKNVFNQYGHIDNKFNYVWCDKKNQQALIEQLESYIIAEKLIRRV